MSRRSKRLSILFESEINELYRPPRLNTEQQRVYFSLNDNERTVFDSLKDRYSKIYFVLLLGYFKVKPVTLNFTISQVRQDFKLIAAEYFSGVSIRQRNLIPSQKTRLYRRVFDLTNYVVLNASGRDGLRQQANRIALASIDVRYVLDECIDYLSSNNIAIPKYSVLQQVVSESVTAERLRASQLIQDYLPSSVLLFLNGLLKKDGTQPTLSELSQSAKNFTPKEVEKELNAFNNLKPHISKIDTLLDGLKLSLKNLEHYALMVDYYTVTKLRRFDQATYCLYLLCYLQRRYRQICEHLVDAFIYHGRKLKSGAKLYAKEESYNEWQKAASNIKKAADLLRLFIDGSHDEHTAFGKIKTQALKIMKATDIESLCLYLSDEKRTIDYYVWDYYDHQTELVVGTMRKIFLALTFQASDTTQSLFIQIEQSQCDCIEHGAFHRLDARLIKPGQVIYVTNEGDINAKRYEVMLYFRIISQLDGRLFVPETLGYRCLNDDLVCDKDWKKKEKLVKETQLERLLTPPVKLMKTLSKRLDKKSAAVSMRIQRGENKTVILDSRSGKTKWRFPNKGSNGALNNPFFERLKPVHIAELLRFVNEKTGFLGAFEHVRIPQESNQAIHNNAIAALIANGTDYGLYRMANISDLAYEQLRQTQANHIRLETLNEANDVISNAAAKLPIFSHYNIQQNVLHASADGQKFESRMNTYRARYSSKYFGTNKGVSAMTLVANHVPANARVIGANEHESHFIFDLLYNNTSEIKPEVLSTDTHGSNHVNFALLDLFGYTFAPRYANFSRVIDEVFYVNEDNPDTLLTLKKPINDAFIVRQWDTIQRIVRLT